jgi:hypothetical protein
MAGEPPPPAAYPPDELAARRLAKQGAIAPRVSCDGKGCKRHGHLVPVTRPDGSRGYDPPPGWWISSPWGHLEILCPWCREERGV